MKQRRVATGIRVGVGAVVVGAALSASSSAQPIEWPALARYEAMAIPPDNPMTPPKVELGKQLFFDPRLSGDGSTACASCHRPEHGLTDGRPRPVGAYGVQTPRACPTLWNIGYQQAFYWEGPVTSLERAIVGIWRSKMAPGKEGQAGTADIAARLNGIAGYSKAFERVFGEEATEETISKALAAFLRTLVANRSAWVRFQDGDRQALSPRARKGWAVFHGKAGCTTCHNGLLLTDLQYHNVGIEMAAEKPPRGRWGVTQIDRDRGAFKTPTLLNIARSAPYFHDGSVATLEKAVDLMVGGGLPNPHRDAALKPAKLSRAERAALLAFLRELTVDFELAPPTLPGEGRPTAP